ncbi:MAG: L-serine ammonia-lyase [Anaerolineae bacterium]|nr:L-serine ammonia-lyase [Anaerolineae bacterium]
MQRISVFDIFKIGVGPSSSHTMGPWRAAERFLYELEAAGNLDSVASVQVELFGSLAKTGRGHGTDIAVLMGLRGEDPASCDTRHVGHVIRQTEMAGEIALLGRKIIPFDPAADLIFHYNRSLPFHPNGIRLSARLDDGSTVEGTYYSIGGGFVVREGEATGEDEITAPYPCMSAAEIADCCHGHGLSIWEMVRENERAWRDDVTIDAGLRRIWGTMADSIYRGCHADGDLPGGLRVVRRAQHMHRKLMDVATYHDRDSWIEAIRSRPRTFQDTVKWVSCFALAVNEENAAFGRVVTAPTNGAAGVIPAVLMHFVCAHQASEADSLRFLLTASAIGGLFKTGATISAALGGCQAEIGVSSAMAAAALTECLGGTVDQALMAAEIAMEHHLGLTCDPVGGLVQIPCIERNAMGAMKAITAAHIALESTPQNARVSLDAVIRTMWETARDMSDKYKETAEGGLAVQIPVNVAEC